MWNPFFKKLFSLFCALFLCRPVMAVFICSLCCIPSVRGVSLRTSTDPHESPASLLGTGPTEGIAAAVTGWGDGVGSKEQIRGGGWEALEVGPQ